MHNYSFQMQKGVIRSCLYLFEQTLLKIADKNSKEYLRWLKQVVAVFLRSIELFEDVKEEIITVSVRKVFSGLSQWMQKSHSSFGASTIPGSTVWYSNLAASEIKVNKLIMLPGVLSEPL